MGEAADAQPQTSLDGFSLTVIPREVKNAADSWRAHCSPPLRRHPCLVKVARELGYGCARASLSCPPLSGRDLALSDSIGGGSPAPLRLCHDPRPVRIGQPVMVWHVGLISIAQRSHRAKTAGCGGAIGLRPSTFWMGITTLVVASWVVMGWTSCSQWQMSRRPGFDVGALPDRAGR